MKTFFIALLLSSPVMANECESHVVGKARAMDGTVHCDTSDGVFNNLTYAKCILYCQQKAMEEDFQKKLCEVNPNECETAPRSARRSRR